MGCFGSSPKSDASPVNSDAKEAPRSTGSPPGEGEPAGHTKSQPVEPVRPPSPVKKAPPPEVERGPPSDLEKFCKMFKDAFVPQSIWVGSIELKVDKKPDAKPVYLEINVTNSPTGPGIILQRLVELEEIDDKKRFSQFLNFDIQPHNEGLNKWVPRLTYEDYCERKEENLTLVGEKFDTEKLLVEGSCKIKSQSRELTGNWSLMRCMAPKKWSNIINVNRKNSQMIQTYSDKLFDRSLSLRIHTSNQSPSDAGEFQEEGTEINSALRLASIRTNIKDAVGEKDELTDKEFLQALLYESPDEPSLPSSPEVILDPVGPYVFNSDIAQELLE